MVLPNNKIIKGYLQKDSLYFVFTILLYTLRQSTLIFAFKNKKMEKKLRQINKAVHLDGLRKEDKHWSLNPL
jgi:hypothetical protein